MSGDFNPAIQANANTLSETIFGWLLYLGNILIFHLAPLAINISGGYLLYYEYIVAEECLSYAIDWCIFLVIMSGLQILLNIRNMYLEKSYFDWMISRSHDVALMCFSVLGILYLFLGGGSLIVYYVSCHPDDRDSYMENWIYMCMIVLFGCGFLSIILGLSICRYHQNLIKSSQI